MQPLCIGVADFTCTEVRAAGARAKYVLANRRVVKRDCVDISAREFIFYASQLSVLLSASSYRYLIKSIPTSSDLEEAGSAMIGRESSVYKDVIAGRSSA